ncbi:MAG: hypothetical protein M3066_06195 [Actinomycetota bacterium]|nr:hypothetical protein [Actinomycetota bacterium]
MNDQTISESGISLFARTSADAVHIEARLAERACLHLVHANLTFQDRARSIDAEAKASELTGDLQLVSLTGGALVLHVHNPAITTVQWRYAADSIDSMSPVKGWVVLARPLHRSLREPGGADPSGTTVLGVDKRGTTVSTVTAHATPPIVGAVSCP